MNQKKILLFVVCLVGLLALQIKYILPLMYDVAGSDLFLVESKDNASPLPVNNEMTTFAFAHCNTLIKKELGEDKAVSFAAQPTNIWTLGNYEYIVNADVEITPKEAPSALHHYVCRIQYSKGDDVSEAGNIEEWDLQGVSGLD
ncbi:MAG: hypothetical protein PHW13_05880 [Methylococcales bacterium]|nr:hypothetical protein [Methylococcales bacterium]